jgi:hypothetical protein
LSFKSRTVLPRTCKQRNPTNLLVRQRAVLDAIVELLLLLVGERLELLGEVGELVALPEPEELLEHLHRELLLVGHFTTSFYVVGISIRVLQDSSNPI